MDTPFSRVVRVDRAGSTNADLRAAALADPAAWPHGSVLVADHQDAGRGRSGRSWVTPPGTALTASVLVRSRVRAQQLGWLPLLTGLAVQRGCAGLLPGVAPVSVRLKWPNDVLAVGAGETDVDGWGRDRKLAGILVEALPPRPGRDTGETTGATHTADAVSAVVGIGVNVAQEPADLPVPWATSLRALGCDAGPAQVLSAVGGELFPLLERWEAADGDADASELRGDVSAACVTLGAEVRTELPAGPGPAGRAIGLDADGRLLVEQEDEVAAVAAGDVLRVRR
ncbi:biotin--[acetyl-CoA-carboxylase] ligase [Georgenia halophila]|uniref:biotin--[acetyl-CoA-carboxylase] ligase n=1 Tax=Georgenia halophila TaxID=620889 RepID=UPI0031EF65BD